MSDKLCPLFVAGILGNAGPGKGFTPTKAFETVLCKGSKCQWWTYADTIEGFEIFDCAMVIVARSNAEGKIPV